MAISRREAFARTMEHLCKHDGDGGHGYSQSTREGDGTVETVDLGDGASVTVANGDRDCSSAIISALKAVGVDTHGASYTGNMRGELLKTGLFQWHPMGDGYIAQRGDIYLNEVHHTAMCTSADPDMLAQFSRSETHGISGRKGDQDGWESNIRSYYSYPWDGKLAWTGDGGQMGGSASSGPSEASVAELAAKVINGGYGNGDERRAALGSRYDEVMAEVNRQLSGSAQQEASTSGTVSGLETLAYGDAGKQVMVLQAVLNQLYGCSLDVDGIFGEATQYCVTLFQSKHGLDADGVCGPLTWSKLVM